MDDKKEYWRQFFEMVYENCKEIGEEPLIDLQGSIQAIVKEFAYVQKRGILFRFLISNLELENSCL